MINRRQILFSIFGFGSACPIWLEKLIHSNQSMETERFDASAKGIIERILKGSDDIDDMIDISENFNSNEEYHRGLFNGLLLAQALLKDKDYHPV